MTADPEAGCGIRRTTYLPNDDVKPGLFLAPMNNILREMEDRCRDMSRSRRVSNVGKKIPERVSHRPISNPPKDFPTQRQGGAQHSYVDSSVTTTRKTMTTANSWRHHARTEQRQTLLTSSTRRFRSSVDTTADTSKHTTFISCLKKRPSSEHTKRTVMKYSCNTEGDFFDKLFGRNLGRSTKNVD
jgi:hypothetical protein